MPRSDHKETERTLPFVLQVEDQEQVRIQPPALRSGDLCPNCGKARLDYDGLLNLRCPACGFSGSMGCHT